MYGALCVPMDVSTEVNPLLKTSGEPRMEPDSEKDFPGLGRETDVVFSAPLTFRPPLPLIKGVCLLFLTFIEYLLCSRPCALEPP